jgi:hypothetical protein
MNKTEYRSTSSRPIAARPITVAEQYRLRLSRGDLPQFGSNISHSYSDQRDYHDHDYGSPSGYFVQATALAKPHPFREALPISALAVAIEPAAEDTTTVQDDIRMFVLSFVTFFMGISLFIW